MKKALYLAPVLLLVVFLLVGAGCETTTTTTDDDSTTTTNKEEATTTTSAWTNETDQGTIPSTDVAGTLNDAAHEVAYVAVTDWDDYYNWTFSNTAPDTDCGVVIDDSAVNFSSKEIQVGTFDAAKDDVDFDEYSAYYHYEQDDGVPMSVNVDWDFNIVVTEFDKTAGTIDGFIDADFDDGTEISGAFSGVVCD